jgi:hypothetical protein
MHVFRILAESTLYPLQVVLDRRDPRFQHDVRRRRNRRHRRQSQEPLGVGQFASIASAKQCVKIFGCMHDLNHSTGAAIRSK